MDFISKLIEGLFVSLKGLLLSHEAKIFSRGASNQLLTNVGKLIFKLQFKSLHHLLNFANFSLAVQNRLDFGPARLLIQGRHCKLLVYL